METKSMNSTKTSRSLLICNPDEGTHIRNIITKVPETQTDTGQLTKHVSLNEYRPLDLLLAQGVETNATASFCINIGP